eukprot:CAMPEP_0183746706 /NCGR_PEP_ID=MMETSP0737-20130205/66895_1 /TAXON_ID=385413 /ORGANISM="Thalassiosira miniscula, Strain CCMP1093" /LENGTH=1321 /DNA_ID=CAMNT_0025982409 /DNA_START=49 /DNA_END=4013 /DNA_ORIENTATION=+
MSAKKSRFDGLDVAAMTSHLKRTMLGFKLANVYDGNTLGVSATAGSAGGGGSDAAKGVYMFKLADPSGGGGGGASAGTAAASSSSSNNAKDAEDVSDNATKGEEDKEVDAATSSSSNNAKDAEDVSDNATKGEEDKEVTQQVTAAAQDQKRAMLLIESGVRFHPTTHYSQSTSGSSSMPSPFAMKLRKHMRNLRLENVTQLGNLDRVVDFRFGSGSYAHHLILELYAQGNLILCDGEYRILALLRTHEYEVKDDTDGGTDEKKEKEEVKVRVGNIYPVTFATTLAVGATGDDDGAGEDSSNKADGLLGKDAAAAYEWAKTELLAVRKKALAVNNELQNSNDNNSKSGGGKGKKKGGKKKKAMDESVVLKALLLKPNSGVYHYGPSLIEHCIWTSGLDPVLKLSHDNIEYTLPEASWNDLITSLREEGSKVIENLTSGEGGGGYILYKPKPTTKDDSDKVDNHKNDNSLLPTMMANQNPHSDKTLLEFQPHLLHQHKDQQSLKYATFAIATDEFFSHLSSQRVAARADAAEAAAKERLAKIQADQQRRVDGLVREQERWRDSARLVESHAEDVDRALGVINSALETGMDWEALEQLVTVEQMNENPIALLIHKLVLDKDEVILALPDIDNWDDSDPDSPPPIQNVTVSIKESAHGNARNMFASYRASKEKEEKTMEASTMALKAAEAKAKQQLAEAQKKKQRVQVLPQRKSYWFEKFAWFITSDNYLVVAGKDAQQNEQLVKRYLRPGDAYLHAEVHGAATCILRAKRRRRKDGKTQVIPLSDQALREAGTFTICRSSAWSSKMVTSAYWVESHQVSKTAPTGEYLTVGSFMIRGRKNFLPASSLEMGLAVLFRLGDDASVARHANERRDFALLEQEQILAQKEEEEIVKKEEKKKGPATTPSPKAEPSDEPEPAIDNLTINEEADDEDHVEEDNINPAVENESEQLSSTEADESEQTDTPNSESPPNTADKQVSFERRNNPPPKTKGKKKEKELSRGKRSKNKRAKKKYAEQDDEDRELAMMALQGGESSKKGRKGKGSKIVAVESETQQKAGEQTVALLVRDSKKMAETLDDNVQKILAKCVTVKVTKGSEGIRWNKFDAEVLEQLGEMQTLEEQLAAANRLLDLSNSTRVDNFSASLAGIIRTIKKHGVKFQDGNTQGGGDGKQRKSKAEKQAEKEAWQEILAEDGIVENDGDEDGGAIDDTAELAKLTGKPTGKDVLLAAIPVCAPYAVLSQYKYRVKLTPGSVKRGKASKQSLEMFLHNDSGKKKQVDDATKRDHALIKLVNENEWVQAMIGDVRITSAGASNVTKKQKGGKGKSKK